MIRTHVLICGGTGCTSSGSVKIAEALEEQIALNGLADEIKVVRTGCFGLCALGPVMIVYPEGTFYSRVIINVSKPEAPIAGTFGSMEVRIERESQN